MVGTYYKEHLLWAVQSVFQFNMTLYWWLRSSTSYKCLFSELEKTLEVIIKVYFKVLFQYMTADNKKIDNNHKTLITTPLHHIICHISICKPFMKMSLCKSLRDMEAWRYCTTHT